MYNKLFTKILDSSIWLESNPTRIIWITMIAAMDEMGYVEIASIPNLARRANVTEAEAQAAIDILTSPDRNSFDADNEGRRIERIEGGWIVLNAPKYRDLVTRAVAKERTKERVAKHRANVVTACNGVKRSVTVCNVSVTPSEAIAVSEAATLQPYQPTAVELLASAIYEAYPRKKEPRRAKKAITDAIKRTPDPAPILAATKAYALSTKTWPASDLQFIPYPATWFNADSFLEDPSSWQRTNSHANPQRPNSRAYEQTDHEAYRNFKGD